MQPSSRFAVDRLLEAAYSEYMPTTNVMSFSVAPSAEERKDHSFTPVDEYLVDHASDLSYQYANGALLERIRGGGSIPISGTARLFTVNVIQLLQIISTGKLNLLGTLTLQLPSPIQYKKSRCFTCPILALCRN
jgi:hypothetical protein